MLERLEAGTVPKGDVIATARVAGIMAAKNTPDILPLCHPAAADARARRRSTSTAPAGCVRVRAACETDHRTGVEMEALCAAAAAALCVHDMCKGLDPAIVVDDLCVEEKSGGKTGDWRRVDARGTA